MSSFPFIKILAKEMILYYESVTALFIVFGLKDQGASEPAQTSIYISLRTQLDLSTPWMNYHGVLFLNMKRH